MPTLTVVAGPNGSGKSTISGVLAGPSQIVIDPDSIARSLDQHQPTLTTIRAGRHAIALCRSLLSQRGSFILESTLAGHGISAMIGEARDLGYRIVLVYVALDDVELQIERVRLRVKRGGHDVPDADIRRRYLRSLARVPKVIQMVDEAVVLDNSGFRPQRLLLIQKGKVVWKALTLPSWARVLFDRLEAGQT